MIIALYNDRGRMVGHIQVGGTAWTATDDGFVNQTTIRVPSDDRPVRFNVLDDCGRVICRGKLKYPDYKKGNMIAFSPGSLETFFEVTRNQVDAIPLPALNLQ